MKRANLFFTAALVPLDLIALIAAASAAYALRFSEFVSELRPIVFDLPFDSYMNIAVPMALLWLVIFAFSGLYAVRPHRLAVEATRILLACSTGIAVLLAIAFFSRELFDSRFIVIAVWILSVVFVIIVRLLVRMLQRSLRRFGIGTQRVLIVGKTKSGQALRKYFERYPRLGYEVVGHAAHFTDATKDQLLALKRKGLIDALMLANPEADKKEILKMKNFSDTEHLGFFYSAEIFPGSAMHPIIHTLAGQPVLEVPTTPLAGWGAIYTRIFDLVVSLLLIFLPSTHMLLTAIAIFIDDDDVGNRLAPRQLIGVMLIRADENDRPCG